MQEQQLSGERRNFLRMTMECATDYTVINSGNAQQGLLKNLSGSGLQLWVDRAIDTETEITVELRPVNPITPPRYVLAKVLRCEPVENDEEHEFAVACSISRFID